MNSRCILLFLSLLIISNAYCGHSAYFSLEVKDKIDVFDYFPLVLQNKWTYENTYKSTIGNTGEIITITWISEVTVIEHHATPDGIVVVQKTVNKNVKYDYPEGMDENEILGFKKTIPDRQGSHYFITGNYVYDLFPWGWDEKKESLTERYKKMIENGDSTPVFFFPMTLSVRWSEQKREEADYRQSLLFQEGKGGAPNPGMYYWIVDGKEDIEIPLGRVNDAWKLIYRTQGGPTKAWFKDKIGVIRRKYVHSGSYFESESVLIEFNGK